MKRLGNFGVVNSTAFGKFKHVRIYLIDYKTFKTWNTPDILYADYFNVVLKFYI